MNYTENYHLPQWDETDRILRTDFNQMCADMEAGLNNASADTAEAAAGVANALATANQALANAAAAQAKADAAYAPDQPPYVVGTYTGTGVELPVNVGFRPRFVIISCANGHNASNYFLAAGNNINSARLSFTDTGFQINRDYVDSMTSTTQIPYTNTPNTQYIYIAFR